MLITLFAAHGMKNEIFSASFSTTVDMEAYQKKQPESLVDKELLGQSPEVHKNRNGFKYRFNFGGLMQAGFLPE